MADDPRTPEQLEADVEADLRADELGDLLGQLVDECTESGLTLWRSVLSSHVSTLADTSVAHQRRSPEGVPRPGAHRCGDGAAAVGARP